MPWHGFKPDPKRALVEVVEQGSEIIGAWCATPLLHMEGFWVHPGHRGGTTAIRLFKGMREELAKRGVTGAVCFAEADEVKDYLMRLGMKKMQVESYLFEVSPCQP